jgi:hypothetical protein
MKKLMLKFSDALLSTEQMKTVKGGDGYPYGANYNTGGGGGTPPPPPSGGGGGQHCYREVNWGGGIVWSMYQCPPTGGY